MIVCHLDAAFVCFCQIGNKVYISTPASKDMNTEMDAYIINNVISKAQLATISDSRSTLIFYTKYLIGYNLDIIVRWIKLQSNIKSRHLEILTLCVQQLLPSAYVVVNN